MPGVACALVDDFQFNRRQRFREPGAQEFHSLR
jgi:hypothetical protein